MLNVDLDTKKSLKKHIKLFKKEEAYTISKSTRRFFLLPLILYMIADAIFLYFDNINLGLLFPVVLVVGTTVWLTKETILCIKKDNASKKLNEITEIFEDKKIYTNAKSISKSIVLENVKLKKEQQNDEVSNNCYIFKDNNSNICGLLEDDSSNKRKYYILENEEIEKLKRSNPKVKRLELKKK